MSRSRGFHLVEFLLVKVVLVLAAFSVRSVVQRASAVTLSESLVAIDAATVDSKVALRRPAASYPIGLPARGLVIAAGSGAWTEFDRPAADWRSPGTRMSRGVFAP